MIFTLKSEVLDDIINDYEWITFIFLNKNFNAYNNQDILDLNF